jgi:hypothetical protein
VRGLKLEAIECEVIEFFVAPFTGAWIETFGSVTFTILFMVAPFTGAWIETSRNNHWIDIASKSHPSRVRGLKPVQTQDGLSQMIVAPFHGCVD